MHWLSKYQHLKESGKKKEKKKDNSILINHAFMKHSDIDKRFENIYDKLVDFERSTWLHLFTQTFFYASKLSKLSLSKHLDQHLKGHLKCMSSWMHN